MLLSSVMMEKSSCAIWSFLSICSIPFCRRHSEKRLAYIDGFRGKQAEHAARVPFRLLFHRKKEGRQHFNRQPSFFFAKSDKAD